MPGKPLDDYPVTAGIRFRVLDCYAPDYRVQFRLRLLYSNTRFEPSDCLQKNGPAILALSRVDPERSPYLRPFRKIKPGGHDPDDRMADPVERNLLTRNVRIGI